MNNDMMLYISIILFTIAIILKFGEKDDERKNRK